MSRLVCYRDKEYTGLCHVQFDSDEIDCSKCDYQGDLTKKEPKEERVVK